MNYSPNLAWYDLGQILLMVIKFFPHYSQMQILKLPVYVLAFLPLNPCANVTLPLGPLWRGPRD